jgi:hypothetical protein
VLLGTQAQSSASPDGAAPEDPTRYGFWNLKRYRTYFNVDAQVLQRGAWVHPLCVHMGPPPCFSRHGLGSWSCQGATSTPLSPPPQEVLDRLYRAVVLFFQADFLEHTSENPDL